MNGEHCNMKNNSQDQFDAKQNMKENDDMDFLNYDLSSDGAQGGSAVNGEQVAVWCEECGIHNIGECFIHGGNMTITPDNALPARAYLSLPKILAVKRVKEVDPCTREAKRGVFSKKQISARTLFGPMEAKLVATKPKLQTGVMEYQLQTPNGCQIFLDISNENECNWMMFVRPANNFAEQNMSAFQKNGQIFFVTCKSIPSGRELRVWYAPAYAKAIGKRMLLPTNMDTKSSQRASLKNETENASSVESLRGDKKSTPQKQSSVSKSVSARKEGSRNLTAKDRNKVTEVLQNVSSAGTDAQAATNVPEGGRKTTRATRLHRENNSLQSCSTCNTSFETLAQLASHICKELGEGEDDSIGVGTRRRKGRPRKLLENDDEPPASKVMRLEVPNKAPEINGVNLPHESIISHDTGTSDPVTDGNSEVNSEPAPEITLLPATALIPTTAEFSSSAPETTLPQKRGPGRPRGSKSGGNLSTQSDVNGTRRPSFTCRYCEKKFASQEQHLVHESTHTNSLPYTCQFEGCGKAFNSKFKYQRHLMVHEKPDNFKCKFCSRTFSRVDHLKNHLLVHDSNRETYTCEICGKSYLCKTTLAFHMAKHAADEGESTTCLVCKIDFDTKEELKKHVNSHNRYKPEPERPRKHACPHCHKMFTSSKDINRHMITHSKERRFLCEHCPQTFVRKDHLRRHYTSNHKKEFYESQIKNNPYGCKACLMVFKKQEFLDYHMKTLHPDGIPQTDMGNQQDKTSTGREAHKTENSSHTDVGNVQDIYVVHSKKNTHYHVKKLLLDKQPKQKESQQSQTQSQQNLPKLAQKPSQSILATPREYSNSVPVSIVKVEQMKNLAITTNSKPYAIVCQSGAQSAASQTPVFDTEEVSGEIFSTPMKTIPFRFQNQLQDQQQTQEQTYAQQQQQQQQQHHIQQDQHSQSLLSQIQLQQQQQQAQIQQQQQQQQQYHSQQQQQQKRQQQQQQQQPQQQQQQQQRQQAESSQSAAPVVQYLPVSDIMLSSLANLGQTQEVAGPPGANVFNIISFGGSNFIVGGGQMIDLGKYSQYTVLKDSQVDARQTVQQFQQTPQAQGPQMAIKSEASGLVNSQAQLLQASVSKPDHCYATATMSNPTLTQMLNNPSRSQLPVLEKPSALQGPCITDEEATRIMTQLKNAGNIGSMNPSNSSNPAEIIQVQTDIFSTQQPQEQQQQQSLQQQQLQQLQQQQQQQQQPLHRQQQHVHQLAQSQCPQQDEQQDTQQAQLQSLPSFTLAWTDNLSDFTNTAVSELPVSADSLPVTVSQTDTLGGAGVPVAGTSPASWILQLPSSVLDQTSIAQLQQQQQQLGQQQQLPISQIAGAVTSNTVVDG